jgi:PilZ domain-containing protein
MSNERRHNERQKVLLEAKWESMSARHEARIDDVSLSGCFVNTYGPATVGEPIELKILLRSGEWLELKGHVATYQHGVGFGLAFTDLNYAKKRALQDLISTGE